MPQPQEADPELPRWQVSPEQPMLVAAQSKDSATAGTATDAAGIKPVHRDGVSK